MVAPIPDPASFDRFTVTEFTLFLIFSFAFGFTFLSVAIKVAPVLFAPKLRICKVFPVVEISNLSPLNDSVDPSDLTKRYLSSSKGRKVSLAGATTCADNSLLAIFTVNVFLITRDASERSTLETLTFGRGVNREFPDEGAKFVVRTLRSVTLRVDAGRNPLEIPVTAVTPSTETWVVPTLVTLPMIGSPPNPGVVSLYWIRSFSFTAFPGNNGFALLIVLTPLESGLTVAIPTNNLLDWITSALKVLTPTTPLFVPYIDLISERPCSVIAIAILPFWIPLKVSFSFGTNVPLVS